MAAFRCIQMSSLLILMLQFKGTTERHYSTYTVTAGRDVTLHCENLIHVQRNCKSTNWIFSTSENTETLFEAGKKKAVKPQSGRLSLSVNCSLVIKKVKVQDAGRYTCRFETRLDYDSMFELSVIKSEDAKTTQVKAKTSTTRTPPATPTTNTRTTEEEVKTSEGTTAVNSSADFVYLLRCIVVPAALAALSVCVVTVNMWTKTKGNKSQTKDNILDSDEDDGTATAASN